MSSKIHLIMPMGGGGTRFGNKGFNVPKPLIMLQGRPFFYWAVQSIVHYIDVFDITFVVLQEHIDKFEIDKKILEYYPDARIKVIPHVLDGAVLTCLNGIKDIEDDYPILFNDCDHAFISRSFYEYCEKGEFAGLDGALLTFKSDNPAFSYVIFDQDRNVTGTVEKKVVSDEAICGAYYFGNTALFKQAAEKYLDNCSYSEFFVSGVYNELYKSNGRIATFSIDEHITFGTPDEYDAALLDKRLKEFE